MADQCKLTDVSHTETSHRVDRIGGNINTWCMKRREGGAVRVETYRETLEEYTATLNGLDEVFGALRNKTETRLVRVEFENTAEGLLGHNGKIIGVIEKHPRERAGDGANTADEFREALANGCNAAVIRTRETECHRGLMFRIRHTLCGELLGDPRVRQHCLADTCRSPENNMRWLLEVRAEKSKSRRLTEYGVHYLESERTRFRQAASKRYSQSRWTHRCCL